jgi:hypothetical protein
LNHFQFDFKVVFLVCCRTYAFGFYERPLETEKLFLGIWDRGICGSSEKLTFSSALNLQRSKGTYIMQALTMANILSSIETIIV